MVQEDSPLIVACLVLLMSACAEKTVEPVYGTPAKPMTPELYGFPEARSRFELPDSYAAAVALFEQATARFEAGDYGPAADDFLTGASRLRVAEPTTYSDQFAKIRKIAYQNAAVALGLVETRADGLSALKAAKSADPENAEVLAELIASLSSSDL